MKKLIFLLICILLTGTTLFSQSLELTVGIGAYYNFYPVEDSMFAALAVLSNIRGGFNIDVLATLSKHISFGPELHASYMTLSSDSLGGAVSLLDISARGIVNFKLGKVSIKPYFGYSPSMFIAGDTVLLLNFIEPGLRLSFFGIYIDGSYLISMEEGPHHFKAGAGYEIRF